MVRAVSVAGGPGDAAGGRGAGGDEMSTTDRLQDRREVAAGDRAYAIGFQDGGWYANGWHITGEMGGIWAPPLKLADGVWFGVDDQWVGPATRFTSGRGYVRYELPPVNGVKLTRTDFVPDGVRARAVRAHARRQRRRRRTVKVDVHSELLHRLPVDRQRGPPDRGRQRPGHGHGRRAACSASPTARSPPSPARSQPAIGARDRARLPRPAHRARLRERREGAAVGVRRRPDRPRRRRAAPLPRPTLRRARDAVVRGRGHARRPRRGAGRPGRAAARQVPRPRAAARAAAA